MAVSDRTWKTGELARETGLTVRTLHHYDRLGLLSPRSRTEGGHRCYTREDVGRLHRIIALRSLGVSLEEIAALLDGELDLAALLRRQLEVVDERVRRALDLRARITGVLESLDREAGPSAGQLLQLIEETIRMTEPVVNDYDAFAGAYSADNETSLINAYYARPAILALAGDVAGRQILDAGCGSGPILAALRDRGAAVTGFDSSAGMLELARQRLGDGPDLQVADLSRPLPYPDGAFDDVIAALVLHYLQDWTAPLAELRRVLKPGGRLIVAVDHPFAITVMHREAGRKVDYFETYNWTEEWTYGDLSAPMSFWARPLHAMTDAFTRAGFRISVISEPEPAPAARDLYPDELAAQPRFLCFVFFVLQAE